MLNRMDLPPGRYQLRFATHDAGGGAVGSVLYDLEVPDFAKAPISMSGIVLTSMAGAMRPTVRPDEQLRGVLPASPVALRSFPQDDELAIFAEIYDNSASSPHKVDITATVTTDEGRVMFKTDEERDSERPWREVGRLRLQRENPDEGARAWSVRADGLGEISHRFEQHSPASGSDQRPGQIIMLLLLLAALLQSAAAACDDEKR